MSKRNIIRVGDIVEITNPEKFLRCGYPLNTELVIRNHMTKDDVKNIDNLLDGMGINGHGKEYNILYDKIVTAIARYKLQDLGWGGNNRNIYTEKDLSLVGKTYKVVEKRTVQTGTRINGWYYSYYNEGESPSFKSAGSHVILKLSENLNNLTLKSAWTIYLTDELFEIEAKNVKKL
jgi:hypothetical protein